MTVASRAAEMELLPGPCERISERRPNRPVVPNRSDLVSYSRTTAEEAANR